MGRRRVLHVVRLVEDDPLVRGKHRGVGVVLGRAAHRQVREQQVVVHDEELGGRRPPPRSLIEAVLEVRAAGPQAHVRITPDLVPHVVGRGEVQVGTGAVLGGVDPGQERFQLRRPVVLEQAGLPVGGQERPPYGDVVPAALHKRPRHVSHQALYQGKILADELLLQVDGVGGEYRALVVPQRPEGGGHEVRQRFAGPRPRLHKRDATFVERLRHQGRHVALPRPILVGEHAPGEGAFRAQDMLDLRQIEPLDNPGRRWLHDHVEVLCVVVDDGRAQALLVQHGSHTHVRAGRLEDAGRMVVHHHATLRRVPSRHQHGIVVSTGHGPGMTDDPMLVHVGQEADLAATGTPDLLLHPRGGFRRERQGTPLMGGRLTAGRLGFVRGLESVQTDQERAFRCAHSVFRVCFFAAGKRTLFRIRRYPGELGCSARSVAGSPIWCSGSSGSCPPK